MLNQNIYSLCTSSLVFCFVLFFFKTEHTTVHERVLLIGKLHSNCNAE